MRRAVWTLLALSLTALLWMNDALAAKRVALVIGIDTYDNLPSLQKAVNDERAVAAALTGLGFEVITGENLTRREMNAKLAELDATIEPGDTVFFFFAGHGLALGAENYLLPSDLPKPRDGEENLVRDEGHSIDAIVRRVQGRGAATSFFVLDACRDNPLAAVGTRSIGTSRGLTRVDTPKGVFVLFSAGLGQTALDRLSEDDPDANSIFTRKLVPLLKTPGLTHTALAKRVQQQVDALAATVRHPQQPAYYDQIIGEIELSPAAVPPPSPQEANAAAPQAPALASTPALLTAPQIASIEPEKPEVSLKPGGSTRRAVDQLATFANGDSVEFVTFSPDGARLGSVSEGLVGHAKLWDTTSFELVHGFEKNGNSAAFLHDGKQFAISSGSWTFIFDVEAGKSVRNFRTSDASKNQRGRYRFLQSQVFSADGSMLVGGVYDDPYLIELWDVQSGKVVRTLRDDLPGLADDRLIALSADGTLLASSTGNKVVLWELATGRLLRHWKSDAVRALAFSRDGKVLATAGEVVIDLWEVSTGELLGSMEGHPLNVTSIAFSPDGALLASGSRDGSITLWKVSNRLALQKLEGQSDYVLTLAFSPDMKLLASGSRDSTIKLWRLTDEKTVAR